MLNKTLKGQGALEISGPHAEQEKFSQEVAGNIRKLGASRELQEAGVDFLCRSSKLKYSYNFSWMGVPIIQFPQDMVAMQELLWKVKPDTVVEAGVARGGSLIFYAGMMEMMGLRDGEVIGIDIDIRPHNRQAIEHHPMSKRIALIEGSSIDPTTFSRVKARIGTARKTMVCLDSLHTHEHVLEELRIYSTLVTPGSYLVVFDTCIEHMPADFFPDRPWGPGNNPYTAVQAFLKETTDFEVDNAIPDKLLITTARGGFLRRK
jgi:cephalosporin hydroxylase